MIVVFVLVGAAVVVAIALVAVGAVTGRLAREAPVSVFDMDEAVQFVADRLPDEVTAELSYDDVRALLGWHLDFLEAKGVAARTDAELEALPDGPVVDEDQEAVAFVLGRASEAELAVDDVAVVQVLKADLAYLQAIGAVGAQVAGPADPDA